MSLQAKFGLLLGFVGLTVVLALGGGVWALNFMHEEVRRPFQVMSSALIQLQAVKYGLEAQRNAILGEVTDDGSGAPTSDAETPAGAIPAFQANAAAINAAMNTLSNDDSIFTESGNTSFANLRTRLSDAQRLCDRWFASGQKADRDAAAESLHRAFMLARRIESMFIGETNSLLAYAKDLRRHVFAMMGFVLITTLLACTLGLLLVRRWVVRPVAELRAAAAQIAAGDFAHRIPVRGRDELAALSTEVNTMASMVKTMQEEAVDRERLAAVGEVVKRIAHNLRSPLAGIRGLAELTRRDLGAPSVAPELRDDLGENQQRIIGAVDRFEHWLKDLLDATRPLELVPRTLDPREWLKGVVEAYRPNALANRIELELDVSAAPPRATFDPRHLEQAVGALISNALDAVSAASSSPADVSRSCSGKVRVVCQEHSPKDGQSRGTWELQVQDNGPGVPTDLRDRIFTPYFTTKREGTGIGLALAQQIVRAHGGGLSLFAPHKEGGLSEAPLSRDCGTVFSARMPIGPVVVGSSVVAKAGHQGALSGENSRH